MRKKLPIGVQTFREIREEGYYYVDKTAFALKLVERGKYFFLSRPRRFGKSLFLDTLKELFEGHETLFQGLYLHDKWNWKVSNPVIRISFGAGVVTSRQALDDIIHRQLSNYEEKYDLPAKFPDLGSRFFELIWRVFTKTGQRVVVLVDEYDKPILDRIEEPELALEIREGLKNLYSVIKDSDAHIRFALLTGVSRFSKVSLFSGLNNLQDITMDKRYSAICGYTDNDVDTVFAPEHEDLDREEIKRWYNGYNWLGESVYNPFDLLLLFERRQFSAYWFETGTPTFLVKLLSHRGFFTPDLARLRTGIELLSMFDVDQMLPDALLFQTGYLTIHNSEEPLLGHWVYTLGYPNHEVESSLNAALLTVYTDDISKSFAHRLRLQELLLTNDIMAMKDLFTAFYASIPHQWYDNNPIAQYEGYYASVFYSYFAALGVDVCVEDATNHGRIDMTVKLHDHVYLFEFKVVELIPEGRAIQQLKDKKYADKYLGEFRQIHLIGVEFSRKERNVVGFEVETVTR